MKKCLILFLVLLISSIVSAETIQLEESYLGAGGPVNATSGDFQLWGSASAQTAATIIESGDFMNSQGFYHWGKMYRVIFLAQDAQRAVNDEDDSLTNWNTNLYIVVHFLRRGQWAKDSIGVVGDEIDVWVDAVQAGDSNYWYEYVATNNGTEPEWHRWATDTTVAEYKGRIVTGTYSQPDTIMPNYYEQYRCSVYVEFDPPTPGSSPYAGGKVSLIEYYKFNTLIDSINSFEHDDTLEDWIDKGIDAYSSRLTFSERTSNNWATINQHNFDPYDKKIIKTITYKLIYQAIIAENVLWREYKLFGVPLYPLEDTTKYKTFAETHGCCSADEFDGHVLYGDQDLVLYDDMHEICNTPADSNCGKWEEWYRIMQYDPYSGGYLVYQGPLNEYNPDRFTPGLGFWGNQTHCDEIEIDVWGVIADTTDSFTVPLAKGPLSDSTYKEFNAVANPFYDPETPHIEVDVSEWRVYNVTLDQTKPINQACASGWLENPIYAWRDEGAGWGYVALAIDVFDQNKKVNEWEGLWVKTANSDSLVIIMYTDLAAPPEGLFARAVSPIQWSVRLSCNSGWLADTYNDAGFSISKFSDCYEPTKFMYPPSIQEPMRLYYMKDDKELACSYYNANEDIYSWLVKLEPGDQRGEPIRLSWSLDNLPGEYVAKLVIPGLGEYNLKEISELTLQPIEKVMDMELYVYPAVTVVGKEDGLCPDKFFMSSVIPNPFNLTATIHFGIPTGHDDNVTLDIFDISGHRIKTLWDRETTAGYHTVVWDGTDESGMTVSTGTYFCRIVHPEFRKIKRAVLLK